MASNLTAMASYLLAMASNLTAMASYLLAMASNLGPSSDGPLSQSSEPVNGSSIKISSIVRPLPPGASGRCPWLSLQLWNFLRAEVARANNNESKGELRPEDFLATLPSLLSEQLWFQQLPGTRHGDPLQTNGLPKGLRGCNHLYIYIFTTNSLPNHSVPYHFSQAPSAVQGCSTTSSESTRKRPLSPGRSVTCSEFAFSNDHRWHLFTRPGPGEKPTPLELGTNTLNLEETTVESLSWLHLLPKRPGETWHGAGATRPWASLGGTRKERPKPILCRVRYFCVWPATQVYIHIN